jgi:peptidoglycan/LPS O-acetylase OafA/YrhL
VSRTNTSYQSETITGKFRNDIQGIRAVAVLMVLAFHADLPVPGGFLGVDVFFVVSGFVITQMILRDINSETFSFSRFYSKRFMRLVPSLALMVTCVVLFSLAFSSPLGGIQITIQSAIGTLLFLANYVIFRITGGYFDPPAHTNPLLHTWSLSVEEQFYFVFPVLIFLIYRFGSKIKKERLLGVSIFIGTTVSLLSCLLWPDVSNMKRFDFFFHFYGPVGRMWEFGAGVLSVFLCNKLDPLKNRTSIALIGLLLIAFSLFKIGEGYKSPGAATLIPVVGTVLLLCSGTDSKNFLTKLLSHRLLVFIGDRSYSLYLWHWPFVVLAPTIWLGDSRLIPVVATILSIGPAFVAYSFVEQRMRTRNVSSKKVVRRYVPTALLVPLILISLGKIAIDKGLWNTKVQVIQSSALGRHIGSLSDCDHMMPLTKVGLPSCDWNSQAVGSRIFLLGDSNADHFSEGVIDSGRELGRPVTIRTANGCPFIDLYVDVGHGEEWSKSCLRFTIDSLDFLRTVSKSTVIISNIDSYWTSGTIRVGLDETSLTNEVIVKLALFREGLQRTIQTLQNSGHEVVLSQTVPYAGLDPLECSTLKIVLDQCKNDINRRTLEKSQGPVRNEIRAASEATKIMVFDPWDWMCLNDLCTTSSPNFFRYVNTNHISVLQSRDLAHAFTLTLNH